MSNEAAQSEVDEIFSDQTGVNRHRPRQIFETPAHLMLMIKRNNVLMEKMSRHIEFKLKGPWLTSKQAAEYIGVSKSHLLHNLKGKIRYSQSEDGNGLIVFHIDDLDNYWIERRKN